MIKRLFVMVMFISCFFANANVQDNNQHESSITVGTIERAPFSFTNLQGELNGFSIELWEKIAKRSNIKFKWQEFEEFSGLIDAVKTYEVALATANISITASREAFADFSHPIFSSGMSIAVKKESKQSFFSLIWDSGILKFLGGALILLLLIAHVVWFFERHTESNRHDYFRDDYLGGVWDAFWWAFIIMTMGGFENEVPNKKINRMVAIFWIITSLFFISTLTAKITTALTVAELKTGIDGYQDLKNKRVGVTEGSSHQKFLAKQSIQTIPYANLEGLYEDLRVNSLDAVVADYPILSYYAKNEGVDWMMLAGDVFNRENYGIIFPEKSFYLEIVNTAILELKEEGDYDRLYSKYFGDINK